MPKRGVRAVSEPGKLERTTVFLPVAMMRNLDLLAVKIGKSKGQIVREAIAEHLRKEGLDPERMPVKIKITHSYKS